MAENRQVFLVSNGVKQGTKELGFLFKIYINEKRTAPKPTFLEVFYGKITWFVGGLKPLFFHGKMGGKNGINI